MERIIIYANVFKNESIKVKQRAFEAFKKALPNESDYFIIATILSAIREIGNTKLGISQTAIDNLDIDKIDLAKIKAIKFLDKILETINHGK